MAQHKCDDPECGHDSNEQAEQKYFMLQMIDAQIKEIEKEISALEQRSADIASLKSSLGAFLETKPHSKSLAGLGLGVYAESEIKNTRDVLVNVGAGVLVRKTVSEAADMMGRQLAQIDSVALQLTQNLTSLAKRAQEIEKEIQSLVK
ncbi:MAG: prefoldin subunit alpha [archaeon]